MKNIKNLQIIPLNPFNFCPIHSEGVEKLKKSDKFKNLVVAYFNFCSIHSEGINFSLGQLNILRTFYIPFAAQKRQATWTDICSRFRRYGATRIEGKDRQKQ